MKLSKAIANSILRVIFLIVIPVFLMKYLHEYFLKLGEVSFAQYGILVMVGGLLYVVFKFLEEISKNPKHSMVYGMIALTFILFWAYSLLNRGNFQVYVNGISIGIDYRKILWILIVLIALRYPEVAMKYYLELRRSSQKKKARSSAGESL